jgi:hypothetical protein
MNVNLLIDAIVRQTTILIAALATAGGSRAPLAHIANQVFADLVRELKEQGLGNKVIADMFGLALRTYHNQISRLAESRTFQGRSLWEAVFSYLQERDTVCRADVLARFGIDDEALVRGVLKDLVDSGLVLRSGRGDRTVFRAARPDEFTKDDGQRSAEALASMVLVAINRHGPVSREKLAEVLPLPDFDLDQILKQLLTDERITLEEGEGDRRYSCRHIYIPFGDTAGWEAAVFDHFQAMVTAVCTKLRSGVTHADVQEAVGGSTYHFDVWEGHPLREEVLGFLKTTRRHARDLRERVEAYNADHDSPDADLKKRVVAYVGQTVMPEEGGSDE